MKGLELVKFERAHKHSWCSVLLILGEMHFIRNNYFMEKLIGLVSKTNLIGILRVQLNWENRNHTVHMRLI